MVCKYCGCKLSEDKKEHAINIGKVCQTPIDYTTKDCLQWKGDKRCGCSNPETNKGE